MDSTEWHLHLIRAERDSIVYSCCPEPYPFVDIHITIQRRPMFFVFNLILPCVLISIIALLGFYMVRFLKIVQICEKFEEYGKNCQKLQKIVWNCKISKNCSNLHKNCLKLKNVQNWKNFSLIVQFVKIWRNWKSFHKIEKTKKYLKLNNLQKFA